MGDIFDKKITYAEYAGEYLDEGWHEVAVYQFEFDQSNPEKPFINVSFRDINGRGHRERFYLTKAALWRWTKLVLCCGIKESQILSARETSNLIRGKKIRINIAKSTSGGKTYNNIAQFEPIQDEPDLPYEDFQGDNPGYVPPEKNTVASQCLEVDDPF